MVATSAGVATNYEGVCDMHTVPNVSSKDKAKQLRKTIDESVEALRKASGADYNPPESDFSYYGA